MAKINMMVDGGNAKTSPQLAQSLGPMKINLQDVLGTINEKTNAFAGVKVPVDIVVDEKTKAYEIIVGSPPTSELIKKELNIQKGSGAPDKIKVGNIAVEQVIKIAKMKRDGMFVNSLKAAVKTVAGSCNSLGVLVESKTSHEFTLQLEQGTYDAVLSNETTEVQKEKQDKLNEELKTIQAKLEALAAKKKREEKVEEKKEEPAEGAEQAKEGEKKEEKKEVKKGDEKKKEPAKKK